MHRLSDERVQGLWDLRASGAGVRRIAVVLGISRNTVRRYLRRRAAGSVFPPAAPPPPAWHERAKELLAEGKSARATALALQAEGVVVSVRTVQRLAASIRPAAPGVVTALAANDDVGPPVLVLEKVPA